jgi:cysteine desulfurase
MYLDCAATTPVEPRVLDELVRFTVEEYGNAGSRTHAFGSRAKQRVGQARAQVAAVAAADPDDVVFTAGATESNNLAILGLERVGRESGRLHVVATAIEHKAVLEPLALLADRGFEVDLVPAGQDGAVDPSELLSYVRDDTLLVSVMHANNETGVLQPIPEIAESLEHRETFFHVDAAQSFGKELGGPRCAGVDLVSVSGHKLFAPKGIGALIVGKRDGRRVPVEPLMVGGGQERGLRPGTLAVGPIAALGLACELALAGQSERWAAAALFKTRFFDALSDLGAQLNGDMDRALPTTLNVSIPGLDAEAAMVALKEVAAVSNGSACTSHSYEPSHVLRGMGLPDERIGRAIRFSWSHLTPSVDLAEIHDALARFAVPV